jgi:putative flippase GtrA
MSAEVNASAMQGTTAGKVSSKVKMNPWKKDLIAALLIGLIAGPLSLVFVANNNINVPWYLLLIGFPVLTITGIVVARILSSVWGTFYKLGKFSEVGGLNFLVDLGVINLLVLVSGVAVGFLTLVYKAISFAVAVINSYLWNKHWVFDDAGKQEQTKEASKFFMASLLGLAVNLIVFSLVKYVGPVLMGSVSDKLWVSIGTVVGSISGLVFNFVLYKIWVFKD